MDFFERQAQVRKNSLLLLVLFALAITVLSFFVAFTVSIINNIVSVERDWQTLTPIGLMCAGFFWVAIAFGCFFRWLDVRGGGARLATRFGAEQIDPATTRAEERQLLHVTAEMAIAAGVQEPTVWVMPYERTINAFVVGSPEDVALVVTKSTLRDLERDELQAVVGHEMGHIAHGDLAINMRLLIVLGGMMALTEVGDTLGDNFVGDVFRVLGGICVFAGTLIRSAFSRRREFLADASSVQFTRNPQAMASALNTILEHQDPYNLECRYRQELAHLCFATRDKKSWFARKLATHPPIAARIKAIDPHFDSKHRVRERVRNQEAAAAEAAGGAGGNAALSPTDVATGAMLFGGGKRGMAAGAAMGGLVGGLAAMSAGAHRCTGTSAAAMKSAQQAQARQENQDGSVGSRLTLMVPDATASLAAIFAIFASANEKDRRAYFNSIAFAYKKPFAEKVENLDKMLGEEFRRDPLAILNHASHKLRDEVKPENRRSLLKNLEKLVEIEHETTLLNYACLALLRRWLDAEHPVLTRVVTDTDDAAGATPIASQRANKVRRLDSMGEEIGLLLSLLLEASGNRSERNLEDYRRVMLSYTREDVPLRSHEESGIVKDMQVAFDAMLAQPESVRIAFIEHCKEVVVADFEVTHRENLLLTLFATAMNVDPANTMLTSTEMPKVSNF